MNPPIKLLQSALNGLLLAICLAGLVHAGVAEIAYSFTKGNGGGVAIARIDTETGKILEQQTLLHANDCDQAVKVRRWPAGERLLLTNERPNGPHLFLVPTQNGGKADRLKLSDVPDEVRVAGDYALVTCADDSVALVDLRTAQLAGRFRADDQLSPPGNGPEDILFLPGENAALVSFQKDGKKGKKFGSRLALLSLPGLEVRADIRLQRDHPELHIEGNLQEQGPSPEVMLLSRETNTLLVTLDLYGAVALMDWSDAQSGNFSSCQYLPTSLDGSWGNAFPDRASLVQISGRNYAVVCNAGPQGGAVLIDLARREIVRKWEVPPGLEKPLLLEQAKLAASVCSGKTKRRTDSGLEKTYQPGKDIYIFDFSSSADVRQASLKRLQLDMFAVGLAPVDPNGSPLILLAAGHQAEQPDILLSFDLAERQIKDQHAAVGFIERFEGF